MRRTVIKEISVISEMEKQQIFHTIKIGHPKKDMKHIKQKQQQKKKLLRVLNLQTEKD